MEQFHLTASESIISHIRDPHEQPEQTSAVSVTAPFPRHSTDTLDPATVSAVPLSVRLSPSARERLNDYNQAEQLAPRDANIYMSRGAACAEQKDYERALVDFNEAIRLVPQYGLAFYNRGNVHVAKKDYPSARADFEEAIRLGPQHPWVYFAVAHLLAGCPKAEFRDGRKAMEYTKKGCELTQWRNPGGLDSVAAACAELGDFGKAAHWEEKAREYAQTYPEIQKEKMRTRLQLYKQGKPYRSE